MHTALPIAPVLILALLCGSPAPAQERLSPEDIVISSAYPHAPRPVYRAALSALLEEGYVLRLRSLDAALLTMPRFGGGERPEERDVGTQVRVDVEAEGDSTRMVVRARLAPRQEGQKIRMSDDLQFARALEAMVMVSARVDSLLEAVPPHAPKDTLAVAEAYGYSAAAPVRLGGGADEGAVRQRRWVERLRGPGGEPVEWVRLGSCCPFRTAHGPQGGGMLDVYEIVVPGRAMPAVLYFDMYEPVDGEPSVPEGFTLAPAR